MEMEINDVFCHSMVLVLYHGAVVPDNDGGCLVAPSHSTLMHMTVETKRIITFFAIYFFFAWALTGLYFITHVDHISEGWDVWHQQIADGADGTSNQFRLLSFWVAEGISKAMDQPIFSAYLISRFIFTWLTFCAFHLFLLKWFDSLRTFLSVTLLAAITPISYLPFLQESDVIVLPFFLLAFWFIREKKIWPLAITIALGVFAKETIVLVIPFYLFYRWRRERAMKTIVETVVLVMIWGVVFYITRNLFFDGSNSHLWQLPKNFARLGDTLLQNPLTNIYLFFIPVFGLLWALPFVGLKKKPLYFRRAAPFIVLYIMFSFVLGWPHETRIILPLAFVVIPASVMTLFEYKRTDQPSG